MLLVAKHARLRRGVVVVVVSEGHGGSLTTPRSPRLLKPPLRALDIDLNVLVIVVGIA